MLQINRYLALLTLTILIALSAPARAENTDNSCRTKRFRCEQQCSTSNRVGSAEHLKCNDQCRDDENFCRKIGFSPDRKYY